MIYLCDYCGCEYESPQGSCGADHDPAPIGEVRVQPRRDIVLAAAADCAADLMWYGRKNDEVLTLDQMAGALRDGEVTLDEIAAAFRRGLEGV